MEDFTFSERQQAQIDADAIQLLVLMGKGEEDTGPASTEDYERAFAQLEEIKYRLANSSDEQLIAEFAGEFGLLESEESDDMPDEGFLTEETLCLTIELDLARAVRCHEKILSSDNMPVLAVAAAVFNLRHLTDATGERVTPLWELALNHSQYEVQVTASYALKSMLLTHHDAFDVSMEQAERLLIRANEIADEIEERRDEGMGWFEI